MIGVVVKLELARHQWAEGRRALERARADRAGYERAVSRVEVVTAELPRRVGQTFTLEDLAAVYGTADRWTLEALHEAFPDDAPGQVSSVADAAFDLYSRHASDYAP